LYREGTARIDYNKLHEYRQKMDQYRYKSGLYRQYAQQIRGSNWNTCDEQCARKCFRESLGTAWFVFTSCLIPQCNCAMRTLPQSLLFTVPAEHEEVLNDDDQLEEDGEDGPDTQLFEAVISLQNQDGEYNLYRDCNLLCHKDCLSIRKNVPFDVLEICVEERCHCYHNYTLQHPPFFCHNKCRDNCIDKKEYYWNGSPSLTECITQCGCLGQMQ